MRLINVHNYSLREFLGNSSSFPNYAILSHTWEEDEVSFQDFTYSLDHAKKRKGFNKIKYCCEQAAQDGFEWAWVDTCCIDKTSSAELSEAINSMYSWYGTAMVCYAYLSDVESAEDFNRKTKPGHSNLPRWFKRGWTLQELIAPLSVKFFTRKWLFLGTKNEKAAQLFHVTGIDAEVLRHERSPLQLPVAQRMYWASRRETTRAEDLSYCLMGLFDVNMPLLYGEGAKAFDRLQEQILRTTNDDTLFLWQMRAPEELDGLLPGYSESGRMLASSPSDFDRPADHGHYRYPRLTEQLFCEPQLMPRQLGLRITLPMRRMDLLDFDRLGFSFEIECERARIYVAALGCITEDDDGIPSQVAILLEASEELDSPEKKVLRRVQHIHYCVPLPEIRTWPKYTCFVAGDGPGSLERHPKIFRNRVDLSTDPTFAIEKIEAQESLDCMGIIKTAFIIHCGITNIHYLLIYAMDMSPPAGTRPKAYIEIETLPATYDMLSVKKGYTSHIPQSSDWDLCLRKGYGPVLEYEGRLGYTSALMVMLKCRESKRFDTYELHVKCSRVSNMSLEVCKSWMERTCWRVGDPYY